MHLRSYLSPKTEIRPSQIVGRGLFAKAAIAKDEIISIKGGYLIDQKTLEENQSIIRDSELQIDDQLYLAPLQVSEFESVMMFLNHRCEPNVGIQGQIVFVAMREIQIGEELTCDYGTIDYGSASMQCCCGAPNCREIITGNDWQRPELQAKYGEYFAWYLLKKIRSSR